MSRQLIYYLLVSFCFCAHLLWFLAPGGGCPVDISALGFFRQHVDQLRKPLFHTPVTSTAAATAENSNNIDEMDVKEKKMELNRKERVDHANNPAKNSIQCPVVFFGGTETAQQWAGYMDGAVEAAMRVATETLDSLSLDTHMTK